MFGTDTDLEQAFADEEIDVDEVRTIGPDPSLMYYHDPNDHERDAVAIALVAARNREKITNTLAATALENPGKRKGLLRVDRALLDRYAKGEIDAKTLGKRVLATWEEPNHF